MNVDKHQVKAAARGRWAELFISRGVDPSLLDGQHHPCPMCDGEDRFRMVDETDGVLFCNQCFSSDNGDGISAYLWMTGRDIRTHFNEGLNELAEYFGVQNGQPANGRQLQAVIATVDTSSRSDHYEAFHELLSLSVNHREKLKSRMLTDDEINRLGYKSLPIRSRPGRARIVQKQFGDVVVNTPGFIHKQADSGETYLTLAGNAGILIPARNTTGRIIAFRTRSDDDGIYRYVTSRHKKDRPNGPSPGAPPHVPLGIGPTAKLVRITEGEIKADIAFFFSKLPTLSVAGVTNWKPIIPILQELKTETARLAYDADIDSKRGVAISAEKLMHAIIEAGITFEFERWDLASGKGIDDVLAAGGATEVLTGDGAIAAVTELADKARESGQGEAVLPEASETPAASALDPAVYADLFMQCSAKHSDGWTIRYWRDQFYEWGTCWQPLPEYDLRARLGGFINGHSNRFSKGAVTNFVEVIKTDGFTLLRHDIEAPAWIGDGAPRRNYIAVENGLIDVDAWLAEKDDFFLPHTPNWFSFNSLPCKFDPAAKCPMWDKITRENMEGDVQRIDLVQEWAGYLLTPDTSQQKFLMATGDGGNGKSVFFAGITALLGGRNVSSVPLESFGERFQLNQTIGKLANISAEIGDVDKVAEGHLKAFTSGDRMQFERKNKDPFEAFPTARLMLATNNPPRITDRSEGVFRRMIALPFRVTIEEDRKIRGMDDPAWWAEQGELPGMLNWALGGLNRLREESRFSWSQVCDSTHDEYRAECNPTKAFLTDHFKAADDPEDYVRCDDVYNGYAKWCRDNGYRPLATGSLGKEIARTFPKARKSRKSFTKKSDDTTIRKHVYFEIKVDEEAVLIDSDGSTIKSYNPDSPFTAF